MLTQNPPPADLPGAAAGRPAPRGWAALRQTGRLFCRTRRSAVALEMAIVALPFFTMVLGTMEVGYDIYVQSALNAIVSATARQIADGAVQNVDTSVGGVSFVNTYVCPNVSGMLECSKILVSVANIQETVTTANYWNPAPLPYIVGGTISIPGWHVCTGTTGTPMLFQALYTGPSFVGALIPAFVIKYGGAWVHVTYASSGFTNGLGYTPTVSC